MAECNGVPNLSLKEMKALRDIAQAVGHAKTVVRVEKAIATKTRPMGKMVKHEGKR